MKQIVLLLIVLCFVSIGALCCSEDDTKETVSDVLLCTEVTDKVESCVGWETFGMSYASVMAECLKATFDEHDACLFECLQNDECDPFITCMDRC